MEERANIPLNRIFYLLLTALLIFLFAGFSNIQQDDSYIYYSYVVNIIQGDGYVFNAGERINATTSPLYTLSVSVLSKVLSLIPLFQIPVIAHLLGIISLAIICMIFIKLFSAKENGLFYMIFPLIFLSNPYLPRAVGMEMFLAMALGIGAIYCYTRDKLNIAALLCSLAVLARPDMALLSVVVLGHHLVIKRKPLSIPLVTLFLLPLLIWAVFSKMYFGQFLPSTLSAKLGQTESGRWGEGFLFLKGIYGGFYGSGLLKGLCVLLLLWGVWLLISKRANQSVVKSEAFQLMLAWNVLFLLIYGLILNPPAYAWYYTYFSVSISLLIALACHDLYHRMSKTGSFRAQVILLTLLFIFVSLNPIYAIRKSVTSKYVVYKAAAQWMNDNVPKGTSVAANEIGVLRYYYKQGEVIDALGLTSPGVAEHVRRQDYSWYVHEFKPDMLMFGDPPRKVLEAMVYEPWFQKEYKKLIQIGPGKKKVALYQRIADTK